MARTTSSVTRQSILAAACRIVHEQGVAHLTLDAVAASAGVSKGGLLYHFPSKDAIIEGLIVDMIDSASKDIDRMLVEESAHGPGARTRVYLRLALKKNHPSTELYSGLLAAVGENPGLLDPVRKRFDEWQRNLENDGIDPVAATIVRLAADGLVFENMFRIAPPAEPLQSEVRVALRALASGELSLPAEARGEAETETTGRG